MRRELMLLLLFAPEEVPKATKELSLPSKKTQETFSKSCKKLARRCSIKRNDTFVITVAAQSNQNLAKSIRAMANELNVYHKTFSETVTEDLGLKS